MIFENTSPQMQKRFEILDTMMDKGYIEPIQSSFASFCYDITKTPNFNNAPKDLKNKFQSFSMVSWYAFFLPTFAYTQTRLEKEYFCMFSLFCIVSEILSLLGVPVGGIRGMSLAFTGIMTKAFVASRYYQYKTYGKCPTNRNTFSTICIALIGFFLSIIPAIGIQIIFGGQNAE